MFSRAHFICVAICLWVTQAAALGQEGISIGVVETDGEQTIVVEGLSKQARVKLAAMRDRQAELSELLKVYTGEASLQDQPPVLGRVKWLEDQLVFQPRFALRPGLAYRVVLARSLLADEDSKDVAPQSLKRVVRIEVKESGAEASVTAVYPSGDVLPENLLKFYVHFSTPMSQGEVYRHVRLLDAEGKEVDYPFVNVGQELWDRSGTRITLLLDPGRIKRGLRPREELGPILHEGRPYEFVIDGAWRNAHGRRLEATFRKAFRVGPPDEVQPDPSKWKIEAPAAGTTSPLTIQFEEPLDHALLSSSFEVIDGHERAIAGKIHVDDEEKSWSFIPDAAWATGEYQLVVETVLEDRAGNSIEKPFEVDVFDRVQRSVTDQQISIPFHVRTE